MVKRIGVFVFFLTTTPIFWQIMFYPANFVPLNEKIFSTKDEVYIYDLNTLRGEVREQGFRGIDTIFLNKYLRMGQLVTARALESFDPQMLFFSGDINPKRSTRQTGVLLLGSLPFFWVGFYKLTTKKRVLVMAALAGLTLAAAIYDAKYFVTPRLPMYVVYAGVCSLGVMSGWWRYPALGVMGIDLTRAIYFLSK